MSLPVWFREVLTGLAVGAGVAVGAQLVRWYLARRARKRFIAETMKWTREEREKYWLDQFTKAIIKGKRR